MYIRIFTDCVCILSFVMIIIFNIGVYLCIYLVRKQSRTERNQIMGKNTRSLRSDEWAIALTLSLPRVIKFKFLL